MSEAIEVKIEINNWYQTYAKINYQERFFFLDRRAGELGIEEWPSEEARQSRSFLTFENKPMREWAIAFPQEPMTEEEIGKWFWHMVAMHEKCNTKSPFELSVINA